MMHSRARLLVAALTAGMFSLSRSADAQIGSGTLAATFISPSPTCIPSSAMQPGVFVPVCDGVGSSHVSWGDPSTFGIGQSSFTFLPNVFTNVALGQTFVMGTLTFFNGTVGTGTEITDIMLRIVSTSATSAFNQILGLPLHITQTPNANADPIADADFFYFSDALQFGSFRVLEGQTATVQILGRFNSLDNMGFGQITSESVPGAGFVLPSVNVVPEPGTLALVVVGLGVVAGVGRRRVRARIA